MGSSPYTEDCTTVAFEGHLLIVPDGSGRLFILNPTARLIWELLGRGNDHRQTADKLAGVFNISLETAVRDIEAIVEEWQAHGLLKPARLRPERKPESVALTKSPDRRSETVSVEAPPSAPRSRSYLLFGKIHQLRCQEPEIEALIHPRLAHLEIRQETDADIHNTIRVWLDSGHFVVSVNGTRYGRGRKPEDAVSLVFGAMVIPIMTDEEELIHFHAGAVSNGQRCLVLPAASGSGKSTLIAALVHAGFEYISEDFLPLTRGSHRVVAVPFGISLKAGSWPVLSPLFPEITTLPVHTWCGSRVRYLPPMRIPETVTAGAQPVHALVFPKYGPGREARLTGLNAVESLQGLVESGARMEEPVNADKMRELTAWLRKTPGYRMEYNTLAHAVELVQTVLHR